MTRRKLFGLIGAAVLAPLTPPKSEAGEVTSRTIPSRRYGGITVTQRAKVEWGQWQCNEGRWAEIPAWILPGVLLYKGRPQLIAINLKRMTARVYKPGELVADAPQANDLAVTLVAPGDYVPKVVLRKE